MEAHGIPKVNLVAAGVGVSDTPGLLVFLDACSREAALKAAMMPAERALLPAVPKSCSPHSTPQPKFGTQYQCPYDIWKSSGAR